MSEQKYGVTNWAEYNESLKQRGSLGVWIEARFEKVWYNLSASRKKDQSILYSDVCIKLMIGVAFLLGKVDQEFIAEILADSGYDSRKAYHQCEDRGIIPLIPPPDRNNLSCRKGFYPLRDQIVAYIKEKRIYAWKAQHNFGRRGQIENTVFRLKAIFSRLLLSKTRGTQEKKLFYYVLF